MDELSAYDYHLPAELLARIPPVSREDARLMVIHRDTGEIEHRMISDLPEYLHPHDCLILNDTQVIPARLKGFRTLTGGKWEGLYLRTSAEGQWEILGQCRGKLQPGETITLTPADVTHSSGRSEYLLELHSRTDQGGWWVRPETRESAPEVLADFGTVPLPPYLEREEASSEDWERYQTIYARHPGSVAAPTAGLHFTPRLLANCRARQVAVGWVTLHVGPGTFRPVAVEHLDQHIMHSEWCRLSAETVEIIEQSRQRGGKVFAVGTTTARTLESAAQAFGNAGALQPWDGETQLFIRPPYQFQIVDALLTNFHLPRSTLLMLVSSLMGVDRMQQAYRIAIDRKYRFYSYGDAMLIVSER